MSILTRNSAWGGGGTAGKLVIPGNIGGGYPRNSDAFYKILNRSDKKIENAVNAEDSGAGANWSFNAANGAMNSVNGDAAVAATMPQVGITEDYTAIVILELNSNSFYMGDATWGFRINTTAVRTYENSGPYITLFTTVAPSTGVIGVAIRVDNSSGDVNIAWFDGTTTDLTAFANRLTPSTAIPFNNTLQMTGSTLYSAFLMATPEARTPPWTTVVSAMEWMFIQHTSAECKADPSKRIVYPGL